MERGYVSSEGPLIHTCLFCGSQFEEGIIYPSGERFKTAERAVRDHVKESHGSAFNALLALGKDVTGISEAQAEVLRLSYAGMRDRDIAKQAGGKSESTIRNHRFQLRKQKEMLVILNRLAELFEKGRAYTEKEINGILSAVHEEYVTVRRYLIDYGFLSRKPDGSDYKRL